MCWVKEATQILFSRRQTNLQRQKSDQRSLGAGGTGGWQGSQRGRKTLGGDRHVCLLSWIWLWFSWYTCNCQNFVYFNCVYWNCWRKKKYFCYDILISKYRSNFIPLWGYLLRPSVKVAGASRLHWLCFQGLSETAALGLPISDTGMWVLWKHRPFSLTHCCILGAWSKAWCKYSLNKYLGTEWLRLFWRCLWRSRCLISASKSSLVSKIISTMVFLLKVIEV